MTPNKPNNSTDLSRAWDGIPPNDETGMSCGWGMTTITYRRFYNFLWCNCNLDYHPFQGFKPKRLIGPLWWIPNLKEAWKTKFEKSNNTYERLTIQPR